MRVSAVINTLNEEKNIKDCLESLSWVDEIIVVDMESDDSTKDICYRYTKQVFNHPRTGYVEPARNFALSHATGDWILLIDADERVPRTLASKFFEIIKENKYDFVRVPRKNIIFGQWMQYSRWWPDHNIRFFKRGKVTWQNQIHSIPVTQGNGLTLEDKEDFALEHYNYTTIDSYLERFDRYTRIQTKQLIEDNYQFQWTDLLFKPISEFLSRFFAGQGYRDGLHGLVLALLQAFSEFVVYLRIWERQDFSPQSGPKFQASLLEALSKKTKEWKYWTTTLRLELATKKTTKFYLRLKRKLTAFL